MIYRSKQIFEATGWQTHGTTIDGVQVTKSVYVAKRCANSVIVKYIDNNGLIRFYQFDSRYSEKLDVKVSGLLLDIDNSQKIKGITADKVITIGAYVLPEFWASLKWIIVSPLLQVKIGDNWYNAKINDGQYAIRKAKGDIMQIELQIKILGTKTIQR